jgi:CHAT domain-containing protein/predicted negative regulator of RcsB-dependent stress response
MKRLVVALCLLGLILIILSACVTTMSLDEAKKVTLAMEKSPVFTPPPRRIDDILYVLNQPAESKIWIAEKLKSYADAMPPKTATLKTLKEFYTNRGEAAFQLSLFKQAKEDLQKALAFNIPDKSDGIIKSRLGMIEMNSGNFQKAIELLKESENYPQVFITASGSGHNASVANSQLAHLYAKIGDLESAREAKRKCELIQSGFRASPKSLFWSDFRTLRMDAEILEAQGKYTEAGVQYEKLNNIFGGPNIVRALDNPRLFNTVKVWYAENLLQQGRLVEAEIETRGALMHTLTQTEKDSFGAGWILSLFTRIVQAQGRMEEAEKLSGAAIAVYASAGIPGDSYVMGDARNIKGDILAQRENYSGANAEYELAKNGMKENQFLYDRSFAQNPMMMLSLLMSGRNDEALRLTSQTYENFRKRFGEKHEISAMLLGLRGMARARLNNLSGAVYDLSAATNLLTEKQPQEGEFIRYKKLRQIIIDDYIALLSKIHGMPLEKELKIDVVAEAFKLAEINRGGNVQGSLVASSVRAAVTDPELAELIRKEQDADRQIMVMENTILDLLAAPVGQKDPTAAPNLLKKIESLRLARSAILEEIKKFFPQYAERINPAPRSITAIQKLLNRGEVLLSFYTTKDKTFIWAVPPTGSVKFATADIGKNNINSIVVKLRKSLDPQPDKLGDIPDFDTSLAYDLYAKLFSPVKPVWKDATDLFIVANNPLNQLPMSLLPTEPSRLADERGELFARYRKVPWLIRKVSVTMEPSVSALFHLRALPAGDPSRKAFVGFGDPLFNREQLAMQKAELSANLIQVRGIRISAKGTLDNLKINSVTIENLNRLPDTAEEVKTVAQALNADLTKDVFLREQASRQRVKTMSLADRKVIAFATHALIPGDLDGLDQPALALSSASVTGEQEDGLLTMTDVMKLKLNADWIILSACNTGAAGGAGAEALSGLGQAFFYAGSRAILASMYPIETTSARKLVTGIFRLQANNSNLTRSQALRKSMLDLIDKETLKDQTTGKIIASYAHPLFWAPFVLMGDPGP